MSETEAVSAAAPFLQFLERALQSILQIALKNLLKSTTKAKFCTLLLIEQRH